MKGYLILLCFGFLGTSGWAQLGGARGDAFEISSIGGTTVNHFMQKQWLYRNQAGDNWFSASLHDGVSVDVSFTNPQVNSRTWWERNPAGGIQSWGDQAQTMMTLSEGNLGIGTSLPTSKLEVAGAVNLKYNSTEGYWLKHTDLGGNILGGFKREGNSLLIRSFEGIGLSVGNSDVRAFTMLANGDVGIGTGTPKEKLSVNGKIRAHEVKVEVNGWPDYVFGDQYKMLSLAELEANIKTSKHLPEVPDEKAVALNGIDLGEMNKLLLKKIEELTLHVIAQGNEIKALKSTIKKL